MSKYLITTCAILAALLIAGCSDSPTLTPEAAFKAYHEARNHHDMEMVMHFVDDRARFEYDGSDHVHGVEEFTERLAFDMALAATSEYRLPLVDVDTVVAIITETNDLRRQLGAGPLVYRARYIFTKGRMLYRHYTPLTTTGVPLDEVMPAFLAWLKEEVPVQYSTLVVDGDLVRTPEAAELIGGLLDRYPKVIVDTAG